MELLLRGGADPNIRDHLGNCSILEAVKTAHDRCLQVSELGPRPPVTAPARPPPADACRVRSAWLAAVLQRLSCCSAPQVLVKHSTKLQMGRTQTAEMLCACVSNSDLVQLRCAPGAWNPACLVLTTCQLLAGG